MARHGKRFEALVKVLEERYETATKLADSRDNKTVANIFSSVSYELKELLGLAEKVRKDPSYSWSRECASKMVVKY